MQNSGLLYEKSIPFRICFDLAFRQTQYHVQLHPAHKLPIHMSRKTRILTANAFLSLHERPVLLTSQIRVGLHLQNLVTS